MEGNTFNEFSTVSILSPLRVLNMKSIYFCCIPVQTDVARGLLEKKILSNIKKIGAQLSKLLKFQI